MIRPTNTSDEIVLITAPPFFLYQDNEYALLDPPGKEKKQIIIKRQKIQTMLKIKITQRTS